MQLIGSLSSPYVRRVAVTLQLMGIAYDHEPLSVFRDFESFAAINPCVKAPTLSTDDGSVLMDSTLILAAIQALHPSAPSLMPVEPGEVVRALRILGLALAACEKTVQTVYERRLRPAEKQHQPWLDRVGQQRKAAYRLLENAVETADPWLFGPAPLQPDLTAAVVWTFTRSVLPDDDGIDPAAYPALSRLAARAEALPAFLLAPAT